jgi:hypothetical protein
MPWREKMYIRRLEFLLPLLVIMTMLVSLVTPAVVLAAGEPPPPPGEKPSNNPPVGPGDEPAPPSSPAETNYTSDLPTAAPASAPDGIGAASPVDLTVEAIAHAGAVLVDANGNILPLASQNAVTILAGPTTNPYFKGVGAGCDLLTGICSFLTIKDALDNFVAYTGSGPIYAHSGEESSDVDGYAVIVNNVAKLTGLVWDAGGINQQYAPLLNGNVKIDTMPYGFKLDGFTIAGGIITNNTGGTLRLQNLEINNLNGDGIFIGNHKGNVDLFNVYSHDNAGYGASIDNTLGTGNVTITNSFFLNNSGTTGLKINTRGNIKLEGVEASDNGNGAELTFGKGATILNSTFTDNDDNGLFVSNGVGLLTLTNVDASNNVNIGANINNSLDVIINRSLFSKNSTGVSITSTLGNIILNGVTSVDNPDGSSLNNSAASYYKKVTVTGSVFQGSTTGSGLIIQSRGGVTLNHVMASGNQDDGINIDNCQDDPILTCKYKSSVSISNTAGINEFYNNKNGLVINSGGNVTMAGVNATNNSSEGGATIITNGNVNISKSIFSFNTGGYGLSVVNKGTILIDSVFANSNFDLGTILHNNQSLLAKTVTIQKSDFSSNTDKGLEVKAMGDIVLNNVTSDHSVTGAQGASLDNCLDPGTSICSGTGNVTISNTMGKNSFSNNVTGTGLDISSKGTIKLTGVFAKNNGGKGAIVNNSNAAYAKTVSIYKSDFSSNYENGLDVKTRGSITLNYVTSDNSGAGYGASLDNYVLGKGTGNITLTNTYGNNSFSTNQGFGIDIYTGGIVTINGTTASNNDGGGMMITNNFLPVSTKSVNINQSFFSNNLGNGLSVYSNGIITLNTVVSNHNDGFGALLLNDTSPTPSGGVIVSNKYGVNQFNNNGNDGLFISSKGNVTLTKVAANFNGLSTVSSGITVSTTRNTTITCSSMQWNSKNGLDVILDPVAPYTAVLSLKSISANKNVASDISLTTTGDPTKISLVYGWTNCGY